MLAYLDCFSGISGDMLLGALVDAGAPVALLLAALDGLHLPGYSLGVERVTEHGISGARVKVAVDEATPQAHRGLTEIESLIEAATLPPRARERARRIFRRLGEAEARIHGVAIEEVKFHELGAVDSIVDIVGVALCLELLDIEHVYCSELPFTSGRVGSAHGPLPTPAPATLELLRGTNAVWRSVPADGELVTPTGAAVAATLARFERPTMMTRSVGYGFGVKKLPWANYLRVIVGAAPEGADEAGWERDEVVVVETNLDNMTGAAMGWLSERLLARGALDVTLTAIQMKKGRPGALLAVICRPEDATTLAGLMLRESGTLGVRMRTERRLKAGRREETFASSLGPARVKLKLIGGAPVVVSPEYDDCKALAERHNLSFEAVRERLTREARDHFHINAGGAGMERTDE
ncbi:MAG TPA: nickel pincer cofactor biosynthesis protein LarC [Ktedonobacterales bacterium]|nr:nickel pincer cofactor biosynthesis protein LarC [Ktedonobacterales bacterium]